MTSPEDVYEERRRRFVAEAHELAGKARRVGWLRLFVFAAAAILIWRDILPLPWGRLLALVPILAFALLVILHRILRRREALARSRAEVNAEGMARIRRSWAELPRSWAEPQDGEHLYARDLDVFGAVSLDRLLSAASTEPGRATLRRWLLEGAEPATIRQRQEAARDAVGRVALREDLTARSRLVGRGETGSVDRFLSWAEGASWLKDRSGLLWVAWVLPIVNLALLALHGAGMVGRPYWLLSLAAGLAVVGMTRRRIHAVFDRASLGETGVRRYDELFVVLQAADVEGELPRRLRDRLEVGGRTAHVEIRSLRRILDMADARFSMLYLPLAAILLWDVHVLRHLEGWQARSGPAVRGWMEALGEMDAVFALAALSFDHPAWCWPVLTESDPVLEGTNLGHPLLDPRSCVGNDVRIGPPGSFLLVTGSNMSGKSTLLRALGLNVVLARAGGPVCASSFRLPPLDMATSMRVEDSLERGVSFFMAELRRLRALVDRAELATPERPLLYLIDEMLQGTNSAERQVAARSILRRLLGLHAIGAVTSHDLQLADTEDLRGRAVLAHFRERVGAGERAPLSFDYRLRPGIATSTNALRLLALMGLGDDPEAVPPT